MITCHCGCGTLIPPFDKRGRPRKSAPGHGNKGKSNFWKAKPDSVNHRTCRWRARKMHDCSSCELELIGGCSESGRIEVHHKDGDPTNNAPENRMALCVVHHRLVELSRIDLSNPIMPSFRVSRGGGKRRYL